MSIVTLNDIVAQVEQLPELPQAVVRLCRMFEDPDVDAQQLAEVVQLDPNLTSQILRICNSAAYGLNRQVDNVKDAIAIIGQKALKSLVYTILSHTSLERPVEGYNLAAGDLWLNAISGAVYAKHIAQKCNACEPETAFTAALLRDLGKIILGEFVGPHYKEIEKKVTKDRIDFCSAEEQVLGFNHNEVGVEVAKRWNLPDNIVSVIEYNHKPSTMPNTLDPQKRKLVSVVHLADAFTLMIGIGVGNDGLMYSIDPKALEELGLQYSSSTIDTMISELVDFNSTIQSLHESFQ